MIILYFGDYDPAYSRNRVIMRGFRLNGATVLECNDQSKGFAKYRNLKKKHKEYAGAYDVLIVGHSDSRLMVPWAKMLEGKGKKVVMDAFYSVYESYVFDRQLFSRYHPKAWYHWIVEWFACKTTDVILCDTKEHIDYFIEKFSVPRSKFIRVLVGSDDSVFTPRETKPHEGFVVYFHGKFIPLQGVQYIVRAAKLLEAKGVNFTIVGSGQTYRATRKIIVEEKITNCTFLAPVPYEALPALIAEADVVLGIFGNTDKAKRVIPNKVYEAAAMEKPVITCDSPAIRELFTDRENILLCNAADPRDLAEKILELKRENQLRERIARGGYELFSRRAKPANIGVALITAFSKKGCL